MENFNPEKLAAASRGVESEPKTKLQLAYEKAKRTLSADRILVEDHREAFDEIYGKEAVDRDLEEVRDLKNKFETEAHLEHNMLATVLEAIIHEQIEQNEWLGAGARTIKPSDYDDYVGGIDEIVEFPADSKALYTGLAIDATTGSDAEKKLKRVRDEIDIGVLPAVKYGHSEQNNFTGEIKNIPVVVVEVRVETTRKLMELWLEGKNSTLARHPVRFQILREIAMQSRAFAEYAKSKNKVGLVRVYEALAEHIEQILSQQQGEKPLPKDDGSVFNLNHDVNQVFRKAA